MEKAPTKDASSSADSTVPKSLAETVTSSKTILSYIVPPLIKLLETLPVNDEEGPTMIMFEPAEEHNTGFHNKRVMLQKCCDGDVIDYDLSDWTHGGKSVDQSEICEKTLSLIDDMERELGVQVKHVYLALFGDTFVHVVM